MVLTVHHLGISQSERIVWLCEELGIDYKFVKHDRDPLLAPKSLAELPGQRTGKAPFIEDPDTGVHLNESAACCDYIINQYGNGRLALKLGDPNYQEYLYWFHWVNGTMQPAGQDLGFLQAAGVPSDNMIMGLAVQRRDAAYQLIDKRLAESKYLAGDEVTAADIMAVYSLTTQRYWGVKGDLSPYPNILRYLQDVSKREAYQRAMRKGDPEMEPLLGAEPPSMSFLAAGSVKNTDHWKKKSHI